MQQMFISLKTQIKENLQFAPAKQTRPPLTDPPCPLFLADTLHVTLREAKREFVLPNEVRSTVESTRYNKINEL